MGCLWITLFIATKIWGKIRSVDSTTRMSQTYLNVFKISEINPTDCPSVNWKKLHRTVSIVAIDPKWYHNCGVGSQTYQ